ncbi:hypothetical protein JKF63_00393 [Porcisia hertigi]|uniref:Uncharacterized protein n=1 Tax=Porcisia hertigi TaxID=2761500 RepID=A0A836I9H2_9TRYP|nr:hypothetical protein JKF63_00393 [Porcisia hertigi]
MEAAPPSHSPKPIMLLPSIASLQQLRRENAILTEEKRFLTQAVASEPSTSARVNRFRYNADAAELKLLMAYRIASELHDVDTCKSVEAEMQQHIADMLNKVNKLRHLLEAVQRDVKEVLEATGGWD